MSYVNTNVVQNKKIDHTAMINWTLIKTFGRIKYFNISYLVLFLVPFLVDFYVIIIDKKIGVSEFPFRLQILYSASLAYALGIAFYQFFCPQIIKKFNSDFDYVNSYLEIDKELFPDKKLEIVISNLTDAQAEIKDEIIRLQEEIDRNQLNKEKLKELEPELNEKISLVYNGCVTRFLLNEYSDSKKKNSIAIYISGLFYIIGTIALLILLIEKSFKVLTV